MPARGLGVGVGVGLGLGVGLEVGVGAGVGMAVVWPMSINCLVPFTTTLPEESVTFQ